MSKKIILNSSSFQNAIKKIAKEIISNNKTLSDIAIVGVHNKGVFIAKRILSEIAKIKKISEKKISFGILDITLYRDDLDDFGSQMPDIKDTVFPFEISSKKIILVDDVLYTGRTVRASIDVLMDFGRPKSIKLAVLVDRGGRELPIEPNYFGVKAESKKMVEVCCVEAEGKDEVFIQN